MQKDLEIIYNNIFDEILDNAFNYKTVKMLPSEWVEKYLKLPSEASRISGPYEYNNSPYVREIIDRMHPSDPTRQIAIMKGTQCGITTGFVVPFMMWCIVNHPDSMLFTSKDHNVASRTMRTKFDLFMQESGFSDYIRSNNRKAGSKRTGDTDFLKEYAGGSLMVESTQNIQSIREHAAKYILVDEFDTAKSSDSKEGSMRATLEGRQNSFGDLAKIAYISTPTVMQTSNIYKAFLEGDQRKWNWQCPCCGDYTPVEFSVKNEDGSYSGLVWKLDENKELIVDSIRYSFSCCGYEMEYKDKYDVNVKGKFIPTAEPVEPNIKSYQLNSLILGPGFITWEKIIRAWLKACPPGGNVNVELLKAFNFIHLGQTFEEKGEKPKIMQLMNNIREYQINTVPDVTSENDGNGEIALITLAADLGGVMNNETEDVRIDWEIVAHSATGATYSINHGSIGTFKRLRTKTKADLANDDIREKLTYMHGMKNSAWPELEKIIKTDLIGESGEVYNVKLSLVDTGHFTKHAYQFVSSFIGSGYWVMGIKGVTELNFRRNNKDIAAVKKSTNISNQYNLDVEQLKDELAENIKLKIGDDGSQGSGFMNFPEPRGKKYQLRTFFKHFESEERKEKVENGEVVGFKWDKRNSSVENHFWDVRIYNNAAKYIFLDLIKRSDPSKYKNINWASFVEFLLRK